MDGKADSADGEKKVGEERNAAVRIRLDLAKGKAITYYQRSAVFQGIG